MRIALLIVAGFMLAGCVIVRPSDAALIENKASNARAFSALAQTGRATPEQTAAYLKADADTWTYFADWANGRAPATQPGK